MATHYRETIADVLKGFDTGITVPDNQQPSQLYMDLAWEGLNHSNLIACPTDLLHLFHWLARASLART